MTESPRGEEQLLPGLEEPEQPTGLVEQAARRTLAALQEDDLLTEAHALICQSLVTLARTYDRIAADPRAKAYAQANLHAQLLATIEALPGLEGGEEDDAWTKLEKELRGATVRDTADPEPTN